MVNLIKNIEHNDFFINSTLEFLFNQTIINAFLMSLQPHTNESSVLTVFVIEWNGK